ncbi:MAG: GNAT family N-acetyltransferase [Gaiellaceae bacterium]
MIALRPVESDADLETWAAVKSAVVPNEAVTAEQLRATAENDRLLLLAESGGVVAGCGIAAPSHFVGRAFVAPRVLAEHRGRGIGAVLLRALVDHARALGRDGLIAFVYADEPHSMAFAERFGLAVADYQLEQRRVIDEEEAPPELPGVELVPLAGRREELLRAAWPVAEDWYADMPVPGDVSYRFDEWLRDEATRPEGSFAALADGELVGYAGLLEHANGTAAAEHGLTVVRRDHRRRGLGRALKLAQLHWAAAAGVAEIVTWTQKGNEAMQALNRGLGYVDSSRVLTYQGPAAVVTSRG